MFNCSPTYYNKNHGLIIQFNVKLTVPSPDDVILPSPEFGLRQRILVLPIKAHQLSNPIEFLIPSLTVNLRNATEYALWILVQDLLSDLIAKWQIPSQGTTLSSRKILHRMERE